MHTQCVHVAIEAGRFKQCVLAGCTVDHASLGGGSSEYYWWTRKISAVVVIHSETETLTKSSSCS